MTGVIFDRPHCFSQTIADFRVNVYILNGVSILWPL